MVSISIKKLKKSQELFLVEGEKLISEIPEKYKIQQFYFTKKYAKENDISEYQERAQYVIIGDNNFDKLADTVSPQGILAICEKINYSLDTVLKRDSLILMGENISDPGNMGTLIRTAAAAGASGAIFTEGSCSAFSPKVIRAAAGASLRFPVFEGVSAGAIFAMLHNLKIPIYAAHPHEGFLPYKVKLHDRFCLLLGNESHGISETAIQAAKKIIRLPMTVKTESLNVAVAGSILMYEAVRQRVKESERLRLSYEK